MQSILSDSELSVFAEQLAMILHSGISVLEGISILREDSPSEELRQILTVVSDSLEQSGELSEALRESGVYPEYFLSMTELGERSGTLEEVMEALGKYYDRQHTLFTGIRDALTYPMILLGMLLAVLLVLMTQVMPVFEEVFIQLGIEIGTLTGSVFLIGKGMQTAAIIFLVLLAAAALICFIVLRNSSKRASFLCFIQKLPGIRTISLLLCRARFANALSIALHSGLDLDEGFAMTCALIDHPAFSKMLEEAGKQIREGNDLADSLRQCGMFTGLDARMIAIGFKTGAAETVFQQISQNCQEEADHKLQNAVGMIEPILTAVLSVLTGMILISVMLPLLSVMTNLK